MFLFSGTVPANILFLFFYQTFLDSRFFGSINCLDPKFFCDQIHFQTNCFQLFPPLFLEPTFSGPINVWTQHFFWTRNFLDPIFFVPKIFMDPNFYCSKIFGHQNCWTLIIFRTQYRFGLKNFVWLNICLKPKSFGPKSKLTNWGWAGPR